jgi:hypothetical protein
MNFSKKTPLLILIFFVLACENKKDNNLTVSASNQSTSTFSIYNKEYQNSDRIEELKKTIAIKGDTIAFLKLKEIYYNSGHRDEFLYTAIFMSNAYKYSEAYFTVYSILKTDYGKEKYKVNDKLANYYLLKAYELDNKSASFAIEERFINKTIPSSSEYWNLIYSSPND